MCTFRSKPKNLDALSKPSEVSADNSPTTSTCSTVPVEMNKPPPQLQPSENELPKNSIQSETLKSGCKDEKKAIESTSTPAPEIVDPKKAEKTEEKKAELEEGEEFEYPPLCESPPPPAIPPDQTISEMSEDALDAFDADYLLRLEEILTEIHRRYYRAYDKYVAEVNRCKELNIPIKEGSR